MYIFAVLIITVVNMMNNIIIGHFKVFLNGLISSIIPSLQRENMVTFITANVAPEVLNV